MTRRTPLIWACGVGAAVALAPYPVNAYLHRDTPAKAHALAVCKADPDPSALGGPCHDATQQWRHTMGDPTWESEQQLVRSGIGSAHLFDADGAWSPGWDANGRWFLMLGVAGAGVVYLAPTARATYAARRRQGKAAVAVAVDAPERARVPA